MYVNISYGKKKKKNIRGNTDFIILLKLIKTDLQTTLLFTFFFIIITP